MSYQTIQSRLQQAKRVPHEQCRAFYKTGVGEYAEHDQFIGVSVPELRKIAKDFKRLQIDDVQRLLKSSVNEERLLALFVLIDQYHHQAALAEKETLYRFYLQKLKYVNNWNLVDASAHLIIGAHLFSTDKSMLLTLAKSQIMWERRIAMVATLYFIRNNQLEWTFKIAKVLLHDTHDLIHKAVGWMLREAGKRDERQLIAFLNIHARAMPRTMLRYAIEKFDESQRKAYLNKLSRSGVKKIPRGSGITCGSRKRCAEEEDTIGYRKRTEKNMMNYCRVRMATKRKKITPLSIPKKKTYNGLSSPRCHVCR